MDIRIRDPGGFLEHVPDAVAVVDRQWRCVYFNAAFQRMIGQDREHLLGKSCWELASAALGNTFEDQFRRAMAQQVPVKFDTLYPRLGIWVETRVFPLPQTLTIFFRDITDRQTADQALRASWSRLVNHRRSGR